MVCPRSGQLVEYGSPEKRKLYHALQGLHFQGLPFQGLPFQGLPGQGLPSQGLTFQVLHFQGLFRVCQAQGTQALGPTKAGLIIFRSRAEVLALSD